MASEVIRMLDSIKGSEWLYAPTDEDDSGNEDSEESSSEVEGTDDSKETDEPDKPDETDETDKPDETDEKEKEDEDSEDNNGGGGSSPKIEELIIPQTLNTFDYYMVFDNSDQLILWKSNNASIFDQLVAQNEILNLSESPKVINLTGEKELYYLMAKMPINIENQILGYYLVARDVTSAYETLDNLLIVLLISLAAGVFVSIGLGYFIAGRSLKPIREAYASKQTFLANASHELKTPLSVIMLSTETLEGEINPELSFQRQIVTDIKDETQKMNHLVSDLLFLARTDSHTSKANFEHFNFTEAIEAEMGAFDKIATSKGITLTPSITPNIKVNGDRKQLMSVFSILVDNAIKYSKSTGQVYVELIKVTNSKRQGVKLIVKDTGIGIPEQELKRIFDRFYRLETSRSKETGGYGLGLAIAKEIVEKHDGIIRVESIEKVGTTFTVEL